MLRGCYRVPSTFSLSRLFLNERVLLHRSGSTRPVPSAAAGASLRAYSSDRGGDRQNQKVVVVGIPNPLIWLRTRVYYFLIRAYFDKEFSIEEFTEGAKQVRGTRRVTCAHEQRHVGSLLLVKRTLFWCCRLSPTCPDSCPCVSFRLWKDSWPKTWVQTIIIYVLIIQIWIFIIYMLSFVCSYPHSWL